MFGPARAWTPVAATLVLGGWGANQFTPLSVVYRSAEGWTTLTVIAMFTVYLIGLVPGLLLGDRAADRFGRRRVVRLALALTVVSSLLLAAAVVSPGAVYMSRLLTGVGVGIIVSAGGVWLQGVAGGIGVDRAVRLAVYAVGAGFAFGPLAAGAMAEWLPAPMVLPCLVHGGLSLLVLVATRGVPDIAPRRGPIGSATDGRRDADRWSVVRHPRFVGVVLPASPAIFAAVTVSYVVLPPLVIDRVHGYEPLFSGLVAAVTLSVGLAVQPLAVRIDRPGTARATLLAMSTVVVGLLVGAIAVELVSPLLVLAAAVVLGAGYGLTLESGLTEIERLASPGARPTASALFQGVAHSGFLAPLLLAISATSLSYPTLLAGLAAVGLVCLAIAATFSYRHDTAMRGAQPWAE
ncbi:MFS transporter [Nocardioides allogilvus]|uniref:MFS transporter n=1 Tax=Nocardioides allogilvus TaxID=2072017 RepID=UPI000D31A6E0|nr:MFS transporter [Nocardioides allogilvus]